jgi:signal transduction histidine kinase
MMPLWARLKGLFKPSPRREIQGVEDPMAMISQSRNELLQVFDGFDDPVVVIDKKFIIQRVNRATLSTLDKGSYEPFLGKPCYEVLHGLKERCPQCTAPATFFTGEKTIRRGYLQAKQNLTERTYDITCYPLRNSQREVTAVAEYYRDSTETVNLTRELYESERARVMEPLAAGLTHQIRQPLTVIRSTAQYALDAFKETAKEGDFHETMESIIQNADVVNDVLSDFTHFSKPSQYQMKGGSLTKVLNQGLRLIQQQLKSKKISVVKDWSENLPEIMMDEKLLLQAYLNLFTNSLEAMSGGGKLTVRAYVEGKETPKIYITIEDTGKGVPKELIPKLSQPFFSTKEGGVGLGLPIAEGIIRSHGGQIAFESYEGKGTKVTSAFPFVL